MPVTEINKKTLAFVHIPKCGGSSIESSLDLHPFNQTEEEMTLRHLSGINAKGKQLQHLTFSEIITELEGRGIHNFKSFTVVRHPFSRIVSEFKWRKKINHTRYRNTNDLESFIATIEKIHLSQPIGFDTHFISQANYVRSSSSTHNLKVFKLEDGLQPVCDWLCHEFGITISVSSVNVSPSSEALSKELRNTSQKNKLRAAIYSLYQEDYDLFGYEI